MRKNQKLGLIVVCLLLVLVVGLAIGWNRDVDKPTIKLSPTTQVEYMVDAPSMSLDEAEQHRATRFSELTTIEETMRLPSEFDQTEALYVIAGRANVRQLQGLIQQALRIKDLTDRRAALVILFMRLADLDPQLAVQSAEQLQNAIGGNIEWSIWRAWSRSNLEEALLAATQLQPYSRKERAAQEMYFAHGVYNSDETDRIEEMLGIAPSRWARRHYAINLAMQSPGSAIEFVNSVRPETDQRYIASELGAYMGNNYSQSALQYADSLRALSARKTYREAALRAVASASPRIILDRWLSDKAGRRGDDPIDTAFGQLAQNDFESARLYWEQIDDLEMKAKLSRVIVAHIGNEDPIAALEWAREAEAQGLKDVLVSAVAELAKIDPITALDAVQSLPRNKRWANLIGLVIGQLTDLDPQLAVTRIGELGDASTRMIANSHMLMRWAEVDTEAAVAYVVDNQHEIDDHILRQYANAASLLDPDLVIGYLPQLKPNIASQWMNAVVQKLVKDRPYAQVINFIDQYSHLEQYTELQAKLVNHLQYSDQDKAIALTRNMQAGLQRDGALSNLVMGTAETDPREASALLSLIVDENIGNRAVGTLVHTWKREDPSAVRSWIKTLANGRIRDHAIASLSTGRGELQRDDISLINSIKDSKLRQQTLLDKLVSIAGSNQQEAREFATQSELNEEDARRLQQVINDCFHHRAGDPSKYSSCLGRYFAE